MRDPVKYVLINLLKNAVESLDSEDGVITLRISKKNCSLFFELLDTGAGIPEEIKNDIFKPFVSGKTNGSGLGLAISLKLAGLCGGKLNVLPNEENKGKGSKFIFELPDE